MKTNSKAALTFIFITILIDVIGMGVIIPVIPTLIKQLINGNLSEASKYGGWLMFSYAIMQFIFAPVLGGLSDRFGRRPILLISLFGLGIDYLFHAFAPTIGWLFMGRILAGIAGASFTTATAYIADVSTPEKRAQNFGLVGAAFGLGFIIGPAIGGIFSSFGPRTPFFIAAGLSLLNFIYGYFFLPESLTIENRRKFNFKRANPISSLISVKRYPVVAGLILSITLLYLASHAVQSNWTFYTMLKFSWSEAQVGFSLAVVGVLIAAVQGGFIRVIIPKLGSNNAVFIGLFLCAFGQLMFAFAPTGLFMLSILVPYALGGIAGPAIQGIISNQVPSNEQGELQGVITGLMSITSIFGPLLMNNLFAFFTKNPDSLYFPGAPFLMGSALIILSIIFVVKPLKKNELSIKIQPNQ
jgi:MFS transporter, DHA1 family, tetracycline resistance protein